MAVRAAVNLLAGSEKELESFRAKMTRREFDRRAELLREVS